MSLIDGIKYKVKKIEKKLYPDYDFNLYKNIEDMKGWVGFITPEGGFYRVRKANKTATIGHGDWAEKFLYLHKKRDTLELDVDCSYICKSEEFNFTMLFEASNDVTPFYFCPGYHLTEEQRNVINALTNGLVNDADFRRFEEHPDNEELDSHTNKKY